MFVTISIALLNTHNEKKIITKMTEEGKTIPL